MFRRWGRCSPAGYRALISIIINCLTLINSSYHSPTILTISYLPSFICLFQSPCIYLNILISHHLFDFLFPILNGQCPLIDSLATDLLKLILDTCLDSPYTPSYSTVVITSFNVVRQPLPHCQKTSPFP